MRTNKKAISTQRKIMDKKIESWLNLRIEKAPPSGWIKAVRGALGMSIGQLASLIGIDASVMFRAEEREKTGKITLELLERAAKAMDCKVVYAIVPDFPNQSLDEIVESRATQVAKDLIQKVEHSMRLENQGSADSKAELKKLTQELKAKIDSRIWEAKKTQKKGDKK
jgi:predicted DNA-binding mobile mystery protein A